MTLAEDITSARHIIDENQRKLAEMRRQGVSWDRITHFSEEIHAWERRLKNLEAAAR
jgi:hypothetical protein